MGITKEIVAYAFKHAFQMTHEKEKKNERKWHPFGSWHSGLIARTPLQKTFFFFFFLINEMFFCLFILFSNHKKVQGLISRLTIVGSTQPFMNVKAARVARVREWRS